MPGPTGVIAPVGEAVATALLSELQMIVRSVRTLPAASRTVAVAWVVCASVIVLDASATLTEATGTGDTVTDELPLCPSLVAVIVTAPGETAVTTPVGETVPITSLLEDHVTGRDSTFS
jgi:hypothetical protein